MLLQEWDLETAIAVERRDAWTEGRTEGRMKEKLAIARTMQAKGKSVDEIAEMTGLTVDDVLRL